MTRSKSQLYGLPTPPKVKPVRKIIMNLCACGCGKPLPIRKDGKNQRFLKGHSGKGKLVDTVCHQCNKSIRVHQWRLEKFGHAFCGHECSGVYKANQALCTFTCTHCHKTFEMVKSRKQGKRIFCSLECYYKEYEQEPDSKVQVKCDQCGKNIRIYPSKLNTNKHFFCNPQCRQKFIMGVRNPAYTSGLGRRGHYGKNWKSQRRAAIKRDKGTCQHCKKKPYLSRNLHVHHIQPFYLFKGDWKTANELTNLITLCHRCHKKAEKGAIPLQLRLL